MLHRAARAAEHAHTLTHKDRQAGTNGGGTAQGIDGTTVGIEPRTPPPDDYCCRCPGRNDRTRELFPTETIQACTIATYASAEHTLLLFRCPVR
jgi:hypothetical protein